MVPSGQPDCGGGCGAEWGLGLAEEMAAPCPWCPNLYSSLRPCQPSQYKLLETSVNCKCFLKLCKLVIEQVLHLVPNDPVTNRCVAIWPLGQTDPAKWIFSCSGAHVAKPDLRQQAALQCERRAHYTDQCLGRGCRSEGGAAALRKPRCGTQRPLKESGLQMSRGTSLFFSARSCLESFSPPVSTIFLF